MAEPQQDWAAEPQPTSLSGASVGAPVTAPGAAPAGNFEEWTAPPATEDWSATPAPGSDQWGGAAGENWS